MKPEQINELKINRAAKSRSQTFLWIVLTSVATITALSLYFAWPRASDKLRVFRGKGTSPTATSVQTPLNPKPPSRPPHRSADDKNIVLTVSGYIVNRERIELSPRFLGVVTWIGVKKGDPVTNGQVVVRLDDAEYKARKLEAQGRLTQAQVALEKANLEYNRIKHLAIDAVASKEAEDNARLAVAAAEATVQEIQGQIALLNTYLDWTTIRSPMDGVVLEKLVDPNELVVPQSFGGTRGPSTALIAMADPKDLQVEIELNEADLSKVYLNQPCRVSPEAYLERTYEGYVAEMAPEANRQKGTLQIKVQIKNPDKYLTPELSAKVDFLNAAPPEKPR